MAAHTTTLMTRRSKVKTDDGSGCDVRHDDDYDAVRANNDSILAMSTTGETGCHQESLPNVPRRGQRQARPARDTAHEVSLNRVRWRSSAPPPILRTVLLLRLSLATT